jgi:serine-type D-Ala-D-Ala carboxypeptidase/endopeptidase (penicillin-binding protein 4)
MSVALAGATSDEPSAFVSIEGIGAVFDVQPDAPRLPASTQKVYTSATALLQLGAEHRFITRIRVTAPIEADGRMNGDVVVVAGGDPSLRSSDLRQLAKEVANTGIKTVAGGIVFDDTRFDSLKVSPGWKPSFTPGEVGTLSAFVVDGNHARDQVADPGMANAMRFAGALKAAGVTVVGSVARGVAPAPAGNVVAIHQSEPLAVLSKRIGKDSDNTYAELVLKELSATPGPGTTAAGAAAVAARAKVLGVPEPIAQYDGSGLSALDRTTTRAEVSWMIGVDRSSMGAVFRSTLAVSCVDGTMRSRLCGPMAGRVTAKTGTLAGVTGLTGFVTTASGRRATFSILLNRVGSVARGRAAIDQAITLLASYAG